VTDYEQLCAVLREFMDTDSDDGPVCFSAHPNKGTFEYLTVLNPTHRVLGALLTDKQLRALRVALGHPVPLRQG
jgi:hypothetical protein